MNVPHSERYLAPAAGLQEAHKRVRIVIDGWPGDVVLIRDVDVIISYTLAHSTTLTYADVLLTYADVC